MVKVPDWHMGRHSVQFPATHTSTCWRCTWCSIDFFHMKTRVHPGCVQGNTAVLVCTLLTCACRALSCRARDHG
jgi:hypothetical protein